MRRSREAKVETHDAIVAKASQLFRERGVENTSVGDVMAQAGLTHGGFYRHFENKDALVAATVRTAFDGIIEVLEDRAAAVGLGDAVKEYFDDYLSDGHVANPGIGCPVPSLGSEIARGSDELKAEFGAGFNRSLAVIAKGLPNEGAPNRDAAIRELAMRIGAIVIARASDATTAGEVLQACRSAGNSRQTKP